MTDYVVLVQSPDGTTEAITLDESGIRDLIGKGFDVKLATIKLRIINNLGDGFVTGWLDTFGFEEALDAIPKGSKWSIASSSTRSVPKDFGLVITGSGDSTSGGLDDNPDTTPAPTPKPKPKPITTPPPPVAPVPFPQIILTLPVVQFFTSGNQSSNAKQVFVQGQITIKDPSITSAIAILQIRNSLGISLAVERSSKFPEGQLGYKNLSLGGALQTGFSFSIPDLTVLNPNAVTETISIDVVIWQSVEIPIPYSDEKSVTITINRPAPPPDPTPNKKGINVISLWFAGLALTALASTTKNPFKKGKRK